MARFYEVDDSGRSSDTSMSVEVIGRKGGKEQAQIRPRKGRPKPAKKNKGGRTYTITVTRERPTEKDTQKEWQCERNGFYYTNDGRCVVPVSANANRVGRRTWR
jgi:hypothetical protein